MARASKHSYEIDDILERGRVALGKLIDDLAEVPEGDRDPKFHCRNLAECVLAVAKIKAEHRAELEFMEAHKLAGEDLRALLVAHLREMPVDEFSELMAAARPRAS